MVWLGLSMTMPSLLGHRDGLWVMPSHSGLFIPVSATGWGMSEGSKFAQSPPFLWVFTWTPARTESLSWGIAKLDCLSLPVSVATSYPIPFSAVEEIKTEDQQKKLTTWMTALESLRPPPLLSCLLTRINNFPFLLVDFLSLSIKILIVSCFWG